jgi:hypothetical protein
VIEKGPETLSRFGPHIDVSESIQFLNWTLRDSFVIVADQFGFAFAASVEVGLESVVVAIVELEQSDKQVSELGIERRGHMANLAFDPD